MNLKPIILANIQHAVVVGAGHGIGCALVEALLKQNSSCQISATYHNRERADALFQLSDNDRLQIAQVNLLQTDEIEQWSEKVKSRGLIDLVINAAGVLHNEEWAPERSLSELNIPQLDRTFALNSFVTPMLAKFLKPAILRNGPSAFVALSAKVGSIHDNKIGGWYSYRASKAALNMFVKTIAIEFPRTGLKQCSVLAIHPGTTETDLSRPFLSNVRHRVWQPSESAANILSTIEIGSKLGSGLFLNWDGTELPW